MFPEGWDKGFAALRAPEPGAGNGAEFGEVLGREVGHLVLLPVCPQILDGIELGRVGGQKFELEATFLGCEIIADQPATVRLQPIPDDEQRPGGKMVAQGLEKGDDLGGPHGPWDKLEIEVVEGDAGHDGKFAPGEAVTQHRGLASRRPGAHAVRSLAHPGLVEKEDRAAFARAVFLSCIS